MTIVRLRSSILAAATVFITASTGVLRPSWAEAAGSVDFSSEFGLLSAVRDRDKSLTKFLLYAEPVFVGRVEGPRWVKPSRRLNMEFRVSARLWENTNELEPEDQNFKGTFNEQKDWRGAIDVRELSWSISRGVWRTTIGYQEVAWGETFGYQILDIVNGRDLRDPLMIEPAWIRQPAFLINQQFFLGQLTLQALYGPQPSLNVYPESRGRFDSSAALGAELGNSYYGYQTRDPHIPEYGGRISYLFDFGLDMALMYYSHYNRNSVFATDVTPGLPPIITVSPVAERVESYGSSVSYSAGRYVFRGDIVHHENQPLNGLVPGSVVYEGSQLRTSIGVDATFGDLTLGVQYQSDTNTANSPLSFDELQWISARMMLSLFDRKLEPEVFLFQGLNNSDKWIQPKLTYYFGSHVQTSLRWDHISGNPEKPGSLTGFVNEDRVLLWLTIKI